MQLNDFMYGGQNNYKGHRSYFKPVKTKHKNSNTSRKVSDKTKRTVFERDGGVCVILGKAGGVLEAVPHHPWYGAETNYGPTRNNPEELVTISLKAHRIIHNPDMDQMELSKEYREKAKQYLLNYYKKMTIQTPAIPEESQEKKDNKLKVALLQINQNCTPVAIKNLAQKILDDPIEAHRIAEEYEELLKGSLFFKHFMPSLYEKKSA